MEQGVGVSDHGDGRFLAVDGALRNEYWSSVWVTAYLLFPMTVAFDIGQCNCYYENVGQMALE